jgi:1-acyl-sn-glycerol-3-phosphate acyltransferase
MVAILRQKPALVTVQYRVMSFFWDREVAERVKRLEIPFNQHGLDQYGIHQRETTIFLSMLAWLYKNYFHVKVHGIEHVPKRGRAMLVGNHSGGVALDGAMVLASMILEMDPPRLGQGMAEKFINMMPFASEWSSRCGQFTGLPEHADRLLRDERLLMVFPEGARGTAKLYWERYSLVDFGTGFMRLALATQTPVVPFAFIGGGDAIPTVMNLYKIGKLMGAPYLPVTPWIFPVPRKVPLSVWYGEPMTFTGSATDEDHIIEKKVEEVRDRIAGLIELGRKDREGDA